MFSSKFIQNRRKMRAAFIKNGNIFYRFETYTKFSKFYYFKAINFIDYFMSTLYMPGLQLDFIFVPKEFTSVWSRNRCARIS